MASLFHSFDLNGWRSHPPILSGGLYGLVEEVIARQPDRPFLQTPEGRVFTYQELDSHVAEYRAWLQAQGAAPGDRVLAYVGKSPATIWLYLACLSLGAVYVAVNPAYTPAELRELVTDCAPRLLVCDAATKGAVSKLSTGRVAGPRVAALPPEGAMPIAAERPVGADTGPPTGDDPAVILYTSGTTGKPRGAVLTHRAVVANGLALCRAWEMSSGDVLLHALPLFHTHGLLVALNCALFSGSAVVMMPSFEASQAVRLMADATVFMGVPTYYTRLLEEPSLSPEAVSGMRLFTCGSAPLLPQVWEAFAARTGRRIVERYGMTEVGILTSNPVHGPPAPGTVGLPLEGVRVRVVSEDGAEAPAGTVGEICTKTVGAFTGYLNQPSETARITGAEGWIRTGDLGSVDADGAIALAGRAKDLVITGGLNVMPLEVETALNSLPGVVESAVFGVPHPDYGEAVAAVVVGDRPLASAPLRRALSDRLAGYKIPKQILFAEHLPRNAMGKVQKHTLRARHVGLFT